MRTIHLHGAAAERFGGPFAMDVRDAPAAVPALGMQVPEFLEFLKQADWRIIRGSLAKNQELDEQSLCLAIGNAKEIHFIPVPSGSASGKGIGKIVVGVALVALSFTNPIDGTAGGALASGLFGLDLSVGLRRGRMHSEAAEHCSGRVCCALESRGEGIPGE